MDRFTEKLLKPVNKFAIRVLSSPVNNSRLRLLF